MPGTHDTVFSSICVPNLQPPELPRQAAGSVPQDPWPCFFGQLQLLLGWIVWELGRECFGGDQGNNIVYTHLAASWRKTAKKRMGPQARDCQLPGEP